MSGRRIRGRRDFGASSRGAVAGRAEQVGQAVRGPGAGRVGWRVQVAG